MGVTQVKRDGAWHPGRETSMCKSQKATGLRSKELDIWEEMRRDEGDQSRPVR